MSNKRQEFFDLLNSFGEEINRAIRARNQGGGQQVPFFGDFASVPVSGLRMIHLWELRLRKAALLAMPAPNEMDAPGHPRCGCGQLSVHISGECQDCFDAWAKG